MQKMKFAAVLIASLFLGGLVWSSAASAHDPIFLDEAQTTPDTGPYMPDGTISWALYGSVLDEGDTRGFEFDLRDGDELYISLLIPNLSPELELADAELPTMELTAPDGTVTSIVPEVREIFDEPFSNTSYVTLAERRDPGQGGRYQGVVTGGAPARFTVAIGETEVFFTETERSGDRPSSFTEIAAPLQAWYATPAGAEPATELAAGEGEIDLELLEEAVDSGVAEAPESALEDGSPSEGADEEVAAPVAADDSGGSSAQWVAPLVLIAVAVGGGLFWFGRRRETASES